MMRLRLTGTILAMLAMIMLVVGCGQTSGGSDGETKRITIGSGASGGVYYLWGGALADIWNGNVPGLQVNVEATTGQFTNFDLMDEKLDEVGMWNFASAREGYKGTEWAEKKYQDQRTLFATYPSVYVMGSPQDSSIDSIEDWNGKRVGLGTPQGTVDIIGRNIFNVLDIEPARVVNTDWADIPSAVRDGQIDAVAAIGGQPWPALADLETTTPMNYYTFTEDQFGDILEAYPYYTRYTLPKGTYDSQQQDLKTLSFWSGVFVHKDMPEDTVYQMTKTAFENKNTIENTHPSTAKFLDLENTVKHATVPLHPGAIRYIEEQGIQVPDELKAE